VQHAALLAFTALWRPALRYCGDATLAILNI
jgi:hypothetical protein